MISKPRKKTFGIVQSDLQFDLVVGPDRTETFNLTADLDYRTYQDLFETDEDNNVKVSNSEGVINAIASFLESDDERERFMDLINDPDTIIPFKTLVEIWKYALTEYGVLEPEDNKGKNPKGRS